MTAVSTIIRGRDEGALAKVQGLLDGLASAHRLPSAVVADMQVALDEVLSNILKSGFVDGLPHRIEVTLSVDRQVLTAKIEDDCAPFDPLGVAEPDLRPSLKDRRVGGLGIHFVRNLMSEVSYARVGARNRLVLRRTLTDTGEAGSDGSA
jgi:serine/threonine-protein kinase RsbW